MKKRTVRIIGVPMDLGQSRRGVDMGPSAIRYAGLQSRLEPLGHFVHDEGNIHVPNPEEHVAEGT
ncbi:MAG: arginase family protein, partial [Candidatus Promineifilaceae bacterium]|nr:arginase family protein [Candidatus Promineifilaceae bacterium]